MLLFSEAGFHQRLAFDNPWWTLKESGNVKFRQPPHRIFYNGFAEKALNGELGRAILLCGPRRVGKTVMMRQLVAQLIEGGVPSHAVMFCNFSVPSYWPMGISEAIKEFRKASKDSGAKVLYAFLDEVQYVPGWHDELVRLAAENHDIRLIAGLSAGMPAPADQLAGDLPYDIVNLPPLTFAEFLRLRSVEEKLFPEAIKTGHLTFSQQNLPALNTEFCHYINYGGFPEGFSMKADTPPPPTFVRDGLLERLLHKDLASLFGISDMSGLSRLFTILALNTANEVSVEDLAKETQIAKNTLRKYLDYLESAWLIRRLHRVDRNAKRFQRAVLFKVYLTSPCFYAALFGPVAPTDEVFGRLAETAVFSQWLGAPRLDGLTYASWRGGSVGVVGFPSYEEQFKRAPECNFSMEMDWDHKLSGPGRGPVVLSEFVRLNGAPGHAAHLLTRSMVRTGTFRGVPVQVIPAALFCYGILQEITGTVKRPE